MNQIYFAKKITKLLFALFLATAFILVSIIVNATPLRNTAKPLLIKLAEDSLLVSKPLILKSDTNLIIADSTNKGISTQISRKPKMGLGKTTIFNDSTNLKNDSSLLITTVNNNDTVDMNIADDGEIKDIINYKATDSIVYDMTSKKMYLYNEGDLKYTAIKLKANMVEFDWNTFTLSAQGSIDSSGEAQGTPIFEQDGKEYKANKMKYNFKTKKGIVFEVVTKEGDAYLHSEAVKKNEYDEWYGKSTRYTTCDLDHPHFYFKSKRVKVVPGKVMVSGPANLWVGDIPTPLYLPFALFPVKQGKRSGIVLPEYGQANSAFFIKNGGYYWAVNDYVGLKFLGQVSTDGTVGAGVNAQYALRYKFNGNFNFGYIRSQPIDKDLPGAKPINSYSLSWQHTQDMRSMPNSNFGVSVQMQSADFYQKSFVTDNRILNTSFNSTINYGYNFAGTPFSITANLRHDQNLLNRTISFTLPNIRFSMSRVAPFKSKIQSDKPKWYESIGFTYSLDFQNRISTFDSTLFRVESTEKFQFGVQQAFRVDAPFRVLKYLNVTPSFDYTERTYFKGISKSWDPDTVYIAGADGFIDTLNGQIKTDTFWKFNSARNFSAQIAFSTKVVGIYKFKGKYLKAIRHVFTPTVSFGYNPNFGSDYWKYNKYVQGNANGDLIKYSVFEPQTIYGVPGNGQTGQVSWSLNNNFEMKTYSKKDTVNHEQKVGLLDQVNLNGGYNFIADSLRLQPFNLTVVAARIFNFINLNFGATFDPYTVDSSNTRINKYQYSENKKLLRFSTANVSASMALHSKVKPRPADSDVAPRYFGDYVSYSPNQIYDFDIPWNLSASYNFNISRGTFNNPDTIITLQTINASADFNITPHWKVAISSGFDISRKRVNLTNITVIRDLHCWELTFNWTPPLPGSSFNQFSIILQPKSPTLKDLKLQRKNQPPSF